MLFSARVIYSSGLAVTERRLTFGWSIRAHSLAAAVTLLLVVASAQAAKLGGPYYVDDAEIGKVGSCEVESWASFAANTDHIYVFSPACVIKLGAPVEIGLNAVNALSAGVGDTTFSLTGKTVPLPIGPSGFGLALSGAVVYDFTEKTLNSLIFEVPLTFDFSEQLRLNIDVGSQYNAIDPRGLLARAGSGVSWDLAKHWSIDSEVFALMGPGQTNPRFQTGLRYSPTKDVDLDVIYGRNLTGEQANWITVALTFRIGDN